jgi:GT2 family glycosyltransferase
VRAPVFVGDLELTEPIAAVRPPGRADGRPYSGAKLLVRVQHVPVGYVLLPAGAVTAAAVAGQVWRELGASVNGLRARAGLPALAGLPAGGIPAEPALAAEPDLAETRAEPPEVSVVVCTRDRTDSLLVTLGSLAALRYPRFEVLVVDNAPASDATRDAVRAAFGDDPRYRYVREPRPGLSAARNHGLAAAAARIVAFTDDDVRVDPWWLDGIARGLRAAPGVACVTGLVAAAELETEAQLYFQLRAGWGESCERRIFDLDGNRPASPLYPYTAGRFGSGANFAVDRTVLAALGGFDEALGAGTPAGGGEDLNMFTRIVLAGHRLVYEPSAVVWHVHRADLAALSRQMHAYGTGCTAALTAILLDSAQARRELPTRVLAGIAHMRKQGDAVREDKHALPSGLLRREIAGLLVGPARYLKGRRALRRVAG